MFFKCHFTWKLFGSIFAFAHWCQLGSFFDENGLKQALEDRLVKSSGHRAGGRKRQRCQNTDVAAAVAACWRSLSSVKHHVCHVMCAGGGGCKLPIGGNQCLDVKVFVGNSSTHTHLYVYVHEYISKACVEQVLNVCVGIIQICIYQIWAPPTFTQSTMMNFTCSTSICLCIQAHLHTETLPECHIQSTSSFSFESPSSRNVELLVVDKSKR